MVNYFILLIGFMALSASAITPDEWFAELLPSWPSQSPLPYRVAFVSEVDSFNDMTFSQVKRSMHETKGFLSIQDQRDLNLSIKLNDFKLTTRADEKYADALSYLGLTYQINLMVVAFDNEWELWGQDQSGTKFKKTMPKVTIKENDVLIPQLTKAMGYDGVVLATKGDLILVAFTSAHLKTKAQGVVLADSDQATLMGPQKRAQALLQLEDKSSFLGIFRKTLGLDGIKPMAKVIIVD